MMLQKITADFGDRDLAHQVAGVLQDLIEPGPDALSIFENGPGAWRLEAYFTDGADARALTLDVSNLLGRETPPFAASDVPDLNWVAMSQAALPPVAAGRFVIHGSHDRGRVARGPSTILVDAGEAFGTAHHATTLGCLLAIDRLARAHTFANVLDLGCGSGVLAIAVAKALPHARIFATDLDRQSIKVASGNMGINGVAGRITTAVARGLQHRLLRQAAPFDLVIANILAGPLLALAPSLRANIAAGGTLVLSGLLIPQASQVIAAYRTAGFHIVRHDRIAGWATLTLRRR